MYKYIRKLKVKNTKSDNNFNENQLKIILAGTKQVKEIEQKENK